MRVKLKWGECTWEEVKAAVEEGALAVAPFGSTEQHGPILPLDTDIHIAEKVALDGARLAFERYGVRSLVMPTMPYGLALHHMRFTGTISLTPETYVTLVAEVLGCAIRHGFRKIAVISGHGGNRPGLELGIAKVVAEFAERFPVRIILFQGHQDPEFARLSKEILRDEPSEGQPGIHAARWETSETLADRPELVRRDRLERPTLRHRKVPEWWWMTHELSETGAFGDPTLARAELGERMWAIWAEAVALFLKRLADESL
jgi:creatinine amidohydrolase